MPPLSIQKELKLCDQIERETIDDRYTALEPNQPLIKSSVSSRQKQNIEKMILSRSQKGNSDKPSISSSQQRLSAYQVSNPNEDQREGYDGVLGENSSLLEELTREGQKEEVPKQNRLIPESNISSQQKDALTSNASFHVRISIGYMTGLEIDKIVKRTKQPTNNRITVGFVELASSGKYTALSQPLLTNVEEEEAKMTTILWANRLHGDEVSESRRILHFSLLLDRKISELDSRNDTDDNSVRSRASFVPEVVKLLVGLKCGDERIPLGIAEFVVNGREIFEQKTELIVLPVSAGLAIGSKTKRGIFGKKQRSSFTNGESAFKLIPNAKLHVKADVKIGYPDQDGAEIWGNEDSSYTSATEWAFDSGAAFSSGNGPPPTHGLSFSTIKIPSVKREHRKAPSNMSFKKQSQNVDKKYNPIHTSLCIPKNNKQQKVNEVPMKYVFVASSNEQVSKMSDMTRAGCSKSWSCAPLLCCGDDTGFSKAPYRGLFPNSFSFESNQMMGNEIESFYDEFRNFNLSAESSWGYPTEMSSKIVERTDGDPDDDSRQ